MKDNRPYFSWCCLTELVEWKVAILTSHTCLVVTFLHFLYHEVGKPVTRTSLQRWQ